MSPKLGLPLFVHRLSHNGEKAVRDIVQFVPYRQFQDVSPQVPMACRFFFGILHVIVCCVSLPWMPMH